ncbi:MAG: hypothetical protein U0270_02365 [Labilithrix sp.]
MRHVLPYAALSLCLLLIGDAHADGVLTPQTIQKIEITDKTFVGCLRSAPDKVVSASDLTKLEGSTPAWKGSLAAPVPGGASSPRIYYGDGNAACPRMWIADFLVTASTTGKWPDATAVKLLQPTVEPGDRQRSGAYGSLARTTLLSDGERAACKGPSHAFGDKTFPDANACETAAAKDICGRLLRRTVTAWKKDGTASFQPVRSSFDGYLWNGTFCEPSSGFSFHLLPGDTKLYDPTNAPADGYRAIPVAAGHTDVYRVAMSLTLYRRSITIQDGNANSSGKPDGTAQFLFNPNLYPPSGNPPAEQFPIRALLSPSKN